MSTFGNCPPASGGGGTSMGSDTVIRVQKFTAPEAADISKISVYCAVSGNPVCTDADGKVVIYSDDGGYPDELLGVSENTNWLKVDGEDWRDFNFNPHIIIPAGDYWIGVVCQDTCPIYQKIQTTGGETYVNSVGGGGIYDNPPNPFPAGGAPGTQDWWICITYIFPTNPYPVGWLKKDLISAYHCFMSAYILAVLGGYDPLKLPDGTLF